MFSRRLDRVAYAAIRALGVAACLVAGIGLAPPAAAQGAAKPNILAIWGDDIGWYNISAYNLGVMGYNAQYRPDRPGGRFGRLMPVQP